mmetsp:Transcript_37896/g.80514  ORF Transcript_37896/g.80514 Transcript_37896/m.80514 type:complete len:370 (+) Transcript_37896:102-1211(+)
MPWSDYTKIREIGSGSFGRAYLVTKQADKKYLVMKEIDNPRDKAELEAKVLNALKHPYIVRYWESFMYDKKLCIVMDYCEGGDLWQYIAACKKKASPIKESQVVRWFTQMCLALKYMHQNNILHRDIKTQNVFLAKKEGAPPGGGEVRCAVLADFGIAKVLKDENAFAKTLVGTPYYLSPEICQNKPYACPSDVWAVGCVLFELCALRVPFEAQEIVQLVDRIIRGQLPHIPKGYSAELQKLSDDLLERNTTKRPTAVDILQRQLIQSEIKRMLADDRAARAGDGEVRSCGEATPRRQAGSDRGGNSARPLGEHNPREPSNRAPSKPGSRAPSPHKVAAAEIVRNSRAPSPAPSRPSRAPSPAPSGLHR